MSIDLTFSDGGLALSLAQAPHVTGLLIQRWMQDVVQHLQGAVADNMGKGGLIGVRTGDLRRALKSKVDVTADGAEGTVWPDPAQVDYGAIQEFGGTVIPKTAQCLTIPLDAMLTGNGVARGTARQVIDSPGAFGFTHTFFAKGVLFGTEGSGKSQSIIPLFALKSSVIIPAHQYLSETLDEELNWIADRLGAMTGEIVDVLFDGGDEAA
jgi:hypothetical protein